MGVTVFVFVTVLVGVIVSVLVIVFVGVIVLVGVTVSGGVCDGVCVSGGPVGVGVAVGTIKGMSHSSLIGSAEEASNGYDKLEPVANSGSRHPPLIKNPLFLVRVKSKLN